MATFAMSEALTIIFKANDPTRVTKQISLSELGSIKLDKIETKKMLPQFQDHQFWDLLLEFYQAQDPLLLHLAYGMERNFVNDEENRNLVKEALMV